MRHTIAALAASVSFFALPAIAQTVAAGADDTQETAEAGPDLLVIGTRAANRTVADSPVPVDVITGDALQASGSGETNKILNQLVPSFNFPQPSIADGSDVTRPATLRGLSPDQTLVLLNGKRRHVSALLNINGTVGRGSAAVDMNMIPALAIKRIDVLRDGASSQYGSDAIAGVINIELKTASDGGRAQVSYGKYVTTLDGVANFDGLVLGANGQPTPNTTDGRYLAANSSGERRARDGAMLTYGVNVGLPVGEGGFFNFTGEYRDRNFTNRQGYDLRPNYLVNSGVYDTRETSFNRLNFRYGDPETEDFNFLLNIGVPLAFGDFYTFATYGHRDGLSAANYRQASAATNRDFSVLTPSTTPNNGNFVALTPDGYLPFINSSIDDIAATSGIRTDIAGFKADLSVGFGRNNLNYRTENSVNVSFGPGSNRVFDAGGLYFTQITGNVDLSREFDAGLAGPLTLALGGEYRNERFQIRPGEPQSYQAGPLLIGARNTTATNCGGLGGIYNGANSPNCTFPGRVAAAGAQGFGGLPAAARTNASRDSVAGYLEFDADLFTGLSAAVAGRYEHFSDFGDTLNGKLALRYELVDGFAIRGSVSNGFRAPSLHQQFFTTTSTNFLAGVPVDVSTVAVNSPVARALGSQPLKPEKSFNLSGGFTASPLRGLNLTVDYFRIKITDRIVLSENLGAAGVGTSAQNAAVQAILNANGFSSVGAARFFLNGLDTTTQGVDAVATYRADLGSLGNWNLTAAYNYTKNQIDERLNNLGPLAQIPGLVLFGRVEGLRFERGQPRSKLVLATDGKIAGVGIAARTTRYGSVIAPETTAPAAPNQLSLTALGPDDQVLTPKWITDVSLSYELNGVQLTVGADNVFDIYPDRRPFGPRPGGGSYPATFQFLPYSNFSPFGFNGRFLYARASIDF
jgi:iron complex outermembrane receptor protein